MDALVSQRGNGALLLDGDNLFWLDPTGRKERLARADLHFLLSGRGDYYSRDDVSENDVLAELREVRDADEALLLVLTVLDRTSSASMRARSAIRVNELVSDRKIARAVESMLWSRELKHADFDAALHACRQSKSHRLATLLTETQAVQPAVKAVLLALESIPEREFTGKRSRDDFVFFVTKEGIVRDLVRAAVRNENMSAVIDQLVKKNSYLTAETRAFRAWASTLRDAAVRARATAAYTVRAPVVFHERRTDRDRPHTDARTKVGIVVSNKMQKTVVVAVENLVKHGIYQKYVKRTSKFLAHAESNDYRIGDRVVIEETRPLSKRKRWNVRENLSQTRSSGR